MKAIALVALLLTVASPVSAFPQGGFYWNIYLSHGTLLFDNIVSGEWCRYNLSGPLPSRFRLKPPKTGFRMLLAAPDPIDGFVALARTQRQWFLLRLHSTGTPIITTTAPPDLCQKMSSGAFGVYRLVVFGDDSVLVLLSHLGEHLVAWQPPTYTGYYWAHRRWQQLASLKTIPLFEYPVLSDRLGILIILEVEPPPAPYFYAEWKIPSLREFQRIIPPTFRRTIPDKFVPIHADGLGLPVPCVNSRLFGFELRFGSSFYTKHAKGSDRVELIVGDRADHRYWQSVQRDYSYVVPYPSTQPTSRFVVLDASRFLRVDAYGEVTQYRLHQAKASFALD